MKNILNLKNKLKKLFRHPSKFFRDYLLKKYPVILNQSNIPMGYESFFVVKQENLLDFAISEIPVDAVFTWVNGQDKHWQIKKNSYLKDKSYVESSVDDARFISNRELYYSVLSVIKNLPWIRKIYIITDNQKPDIPLQAKNKVFLIDHSDIIPQEFLPTFNSHVIEAYLHRIEDLSEHFIYFNDDFFVARPLNKTHFFLGNGLASLFLSEKSLEKMEEKKIKTPTQYASSNCNKIFYQDYGRKFDKPLAHIYVPLTKSMYYYAHKKYSNYILDFSSNKFREKNDLNMATFFIPYLQYLYGKAYPQIDICYYFNIRSNNANFCYNQLLNLKKNNESPHSFCANDFSISLNDKNEPSISLEKFLKKYYLEE